jgi:hypothetical protein
LDPSAASVTSSPLSWGRIRVSSTVPVPINRVKSHGVTDVEQLRSPHHGRLRNLFRMNIAELSPRRGPGRLYGIGVPGAAEPGAGSAPSCTRKA